MRAVRERRGCDAAPFPLAERTRGSAQGLAGMRSEHLEITVEGNRIKITGNRPDGCRAAKASFLVMEINYGPFESVLDLPEGYDLSQARAAYLNGFLRIDVPMAQRKPKNCRVSVVDGG